MNSNFSFVKEKNEELYESLLEIESSVKINPSDAGNKIRKVLEKLCSIYENEYELLQKMKEFTPRKIDLSMELFLLSDGNGFIKSLNHPALKPFPVFNVELEYKGSDGIKHSCFENPEEVPQNSREFFGKCYNFLRQMSNEYSHNDSNEKYQRYFEKSYGNIIHTLKILHRYIKEIYGFGKYEVPPFDEDIMPIGNYEIIKGVIPPDTVRTGCEKEYTALRYEDMFPASVGSSVIRQYPRNNENRIFLRRASEVFGISDNCGAVLKGITVLSDMKKSDSPYYLIAYDLQKGAEKLSTEFLSRLTLEERCGLCLSYARDLAFFHTNTSPVYHRILSSECVYYADGRERGKGISTAIIKFEYAKISDTETYTVMNGILPEITASDARYIADEWHSLANADDLSWAKADIYSLGILFSDILMGSIGGYRPDHIGRKKELSPFLPLLEEMTGRSDARPDITRVCNTLERINGEIK